MTSVRAILEIDGITKRFFGNSDSESPLVLKGLDLKIERGKITALIGANGAGKTTLFNIISGLAKPDLGTVTYYNKTGLPHYVVKKTKKNLGKSVFMSPHQIANLGIGRLFQNLRIFKNMSLIENVMIGSGKRNGEMPFSSVLSAKAKQVEFQRVTMATDIIYSILGNTFDPRDVDSSSTKSRNFFLTRLLAPFCRRYEKYGDVFRPSILKIIQDDTFLRDASDFSYGQQRLISMAALFMGNYDLLLLDEPTAGVNPEIIEKILDIIKKTVKETGRTVLMIEHNMDAVLKIADYCYFIDEGNIKHFGSPEDVLGNPKVRREYLGI